MARLSFSSLRVRLLFLVLVALVPALGLILYTSSKLREIAAREAYDDSRHVVRTLATEHERIIDSGRQLLMSLANLPQILKHDAEGCAKVISNVMKNLKFFTTLAVARPDGEVFCSTAVDSAPVNLSERPYFPQVLQTRAFTVSDFTIGRFSKKPVITLSYPSIDERGELRAILVVGLDLSWFRDIVADARLPWGSNVAVVDRHGVMLARSPDEAENATGEIAPETSIVKTVLEKREGTAEGVGLDGVPRLYAFMPLRGLSEGGTVYVWAGIPKEAVFTEADRIFSMSIAGLGLVAVLTLALAWTGSNVFVLRQVNKLIGATKRISSGELSARAGVAYDQGEFGQLAQSFDVMASSLERRHQQTKALHDIDLAINSTLDLHAVLDVLLEKIDYSLPYAVTTVRLLNNKTGQLEPFACRNVDEKEWKHATANPTSGPAGMLSPDGAPVIIRDIQRDSRALSFEFVRKHGLVSCLRVPLVAKARLLGMLAFFTKEDHEFSEQEVEYLMALAGQAAIAIHNAQLYEEISLAKRELEEASRFLDRSLKQLGSLYTALTPLAAAQSTTEMMAGIIDRLLDATGADAALIRLRDPKEDRYTVVSQRNFPDDYQQRVEAASGAVTVRQVVATGQPIIVPDIASDARLKSKVHLQLGFRSCALLPLKVENEVRGVMQIASRKLGYFDEEQEPHLSAIAQQMGIALENRELYNELKSSRDDLERASKGKDEFLSVISHELRPPLNVIVGYAQLIKDEALGEINSQQGMALATMARQADDLLSMISGILEVTRIEAEAVQIVTREVNLGDFLDKLRSNFDRPMEKELSLNWDFPFDLPVLTIDDEKLKHVLHNLISNAVKFTDKGVVSISARHHPQTATMEFKIMDTGIGIPRDKVPDIFERFRQIDSSVTRSYGGVGIGLYIVKKYTQLLGGEIEVESEPGKGSIFSVRLPDGTKVNSTARRAVINFA